VTQDQLATSTISILLAEDFEPCRRLIVSLLNENPAFQVRWEAFDGLEAVAKAQELVPDVVLIDIGLPKLNGLDAAWRILDLIPSVKIIFLTQEADLDVVKEAFRIGARGYVLKQEVESDLLEALSAVFHNRRYLSRRLSPALAAMFINERPVTKQDPSHTLTHFH
jgi:DNA-binding NarL/FixJ family response regulator